MSHLLDTDTVVDWLNLVDPVTALLTRIVGDGLAISIISYAELYEGIYGGRNPVAAERAFRNFLQDVTVLGISRAVAQRHARLRLELRLQKRPVDHRTLDLLIAATALTHDLTLVTSNTRDYTDIAGLRLLNPRSSAE